MTTNLSHISEKFNHIIESYLSIPDNTTGIITETQAALKQTRDYFLQDFFSKLDPFSGEISFSYNGGKDCQVLLIIYLGCLWKLSLNRNEKLLNPHQNFPLKKISAVYINQAETFSSIEQFVKITSDRYFLSLYDSPEDKLVDMRMAFKNYIKFHPTTKAIIIGTRSSDPFSRCLKPIQYTDDNWPKFIRLQPLLHWNLQNIWSFLLYSNEEMCGLYKIGFTSIGGIKTTIRNPYLKQVDDAENDTLQNKFEWEIRNAYGDEKSGIVHSSSISISDQKLIMRDDTSIYYPGWYLTDDAHERCGRMLN